MANARFYLDWRRTKGETPSVLKIAIAQKAQTAYISLNVKLLPGQWDEKNRIVKRTDAAVLNAYISEMKEGVDSIIADLTRARQIDDMSATQIRDYCIVEINPEKKAAKEMETTFLYRFQKYAERLSESSQRIYEHTQKRLIAFIGEAKLKELRFEDITKDWLCDFDSFMSKTSSRNTRNLHFRNIRAVFNDAIDNDLTANYPFRKFKLKNVETEKRAISVEELRCLYYFKCEPHAEKYVDMFILSFFLRGVNLKDLALLKPTDLEKGRLVFNRSKTGHLYSMLVEPETKQIIEKHKGTEHLLFILDRWKSDNFFRRKMNKEIQKIGPMHKAPGRGGKKVYEPMFPDLTIYCARHTWATIAADLDLTNETIAEGLGHEYGNKTTNIYIKFNKKKVDAANRKVIDWVLYGKIDGNVVVEPGTPEFFGLDKKKAAQLGLLKADPTEPQNED